MTRAATPKGTGQFRDRFPDLAAQGHFRAFRELWLSSIGLGSYLGNADERTDEAYRQAVEKAVSLGCNVFDTAANYRFQRSERSFGDAFSQLFARGLVKREELFVSTKGGYLPFDGQQPRGRQEMIAYLEKTFIQPGICAWDDFVQGSHCLTPKYLEHQLAQSLRNLRLDGVDVYYLHNPESQLAEVSPEEFERRLRAAFEMLERAVADGRIAMYGAATWNGFRVPSRQMDHLSLARMVEAAREVGGDNHHFRVVQLPVNLAMPEAFTLANQTLREQTISFLEAAADLGLLVMASASILQARLSQGLPPIIASTLQGPRTDAQRAIQFTRSTPGVHTALVGMSSVAHVEENLELARLAPASSAEYLQLFG